MIPSNNERRLARIGITAEFLQDHNVWYAIANYFKDNKCIIHDIRYDMERAIYSILIEGSHLEPTLEGSVIPMIALEVSPQIIE